MQTPIKINSWKEEEFEKELLSIPKNQTLIFELNNQLAKNFSKLIEHYSNTKPKLILQKSPEKLELLCKIIIRKYLKKNFPQVIGNTNIIFENFEPQDLEEFFSFHNYIYYCIKTKTQPQIPKIKIDVQKQIQQENSMQFKNFSEFKILQNFYSKNKNTSYFLFPQEKNKQRFVFYFYITDENTKQSIIKILIELGINSQITELIKKIPFGVNSIFYAIGFSYQNNSLIRTSFYTRFLTSKTSDKNNLFIKNNFPQLSKFNFENLRDYAIDIFNNNELEYKFYMDKSHFNEKLSDKTIEKILSNKSCTKVIKIKNSSISNIKYEFATKQFNLKEKLHILKKENINKNIKIFSIYIKNQKIIKTILY